MSTSPSPFYPSGSTPRDKESNDDVLLAQERREERVQAPTLTKFLNQTLDSIRDLDASQNLKIHNEMARNVAYFDNRMDGKAVNGEWVDNPRLANEISPQDNEFKRQIEKLLMEMSRSPIRYDLEPVDKSDQAKRECADFIRKRIQVNQSRIETEPFVQAENQSLLLKLWTLRYTFFDPNADSGEVAMEAEVIRQMVDGQVVQVCRTCGMSTSGGPCPNCGDTETKSIAAPPSEQVQVHHKRVNKGRVVTVRPDATMVQLDLNARDIQSSPFLRWRLAMRRCDWEQMYPNQRIPSSEQSDEGRWREQAESYPSNSLRDSYSGDAGGNQFEKIEGELVWLDPKVYARKVSRENERVGNVIIPANTEYGKVWPNGICVARIANKVLDIHQSNKNTCWTMCVYGIREHALHGAGTTALTHLQDIIDDENAFIVGHHYQAAAGREFIRSGAIEGGKLPNINQVGIVNNCPEDKNPAEFAYGRSSPENLAGDVYAFREAMRGSMQDSAGTSSLSTAGAASDLGALGTATGIDALRDQAVGRMIPNRKLQAHMGVEWLKQVLMLERQHFNAEMFLTLADKPDERGAVEFKERGVREFFQCDLLHDFIFFPVAGSWVPRAPTQDKADATEFAYLAGQMKGVPEASQILSKIAPVMGVDFDVNEWGAAQRMGAMRLAQYARACKALEPLGAQPQDVLASVPEWARVDPQLDNHGAFRNYYTDWMMSDEAINASPLLRAVVHEVWAQHGEGNVTQGQQMVAEQTLAQVPQKVGELTAQDAQHQQTLDHHTEAQDAIDERNLARTLVMPPAPPESQLSDKTS